MCLCGDLLGSCSSGRYALPKSLCQSVALRRGVMLKELLDHVDDCGGSGWRYSLPVVPGVDFLDQLRLYPDVDIRGFSFHAVEVGRCRAACLIIRAKKLTLMLI